jgi:hypothetical protein
MFKALKKGFIIALVAASLCGLFGCSNFGKDSALEFYNNAISYFGEKSLTDDHSLAGKRTFGADKYVGSYSADYNGFSKTEYLFGGTSIERKNGNEVNIACDMTVTKGSAKLFLVCGDSERQVLLDAAGEYSQTLDIPQSSWYVGLEGSNFTGTMQLSITDVVK